MSGYFFINLPQHGSGIAKIAPLPTMPPAQNSPKLPNSHRGLAVIAMGSLQDQDSTAR
jgi:hypothetical protein